MGAISDAQSNRLDQFLQSIQARALRSAEIATHSREDAMDLVQDSMIALAGDYADRPEQEWPPLFYRILNNAILQFHRKRRRRHRWLGWMETDDAILDAIPDPGPNPAQSLQHDQSMQTLLRTMEKLSLRQRQVVSLRIWEGLDVRDTAKAMGCGQGSVKTHLSRALSILREQLQAVADVH